MGRWLALSAVAVVLLSACGQAGAPAAASSTPETMGAPAAGPSAAPPQPTPAPAVTFTLAVDTPVVTHGASGTYDGMYTDPGAVGYMDGGFHMFPNGFPDWPAKVGVGHAVSDDGLHWTRQGPQPVFTEAGIDYAKFTLLASSVLKDGDQYVLYFYTWDSQASAASSSIGRATASDLAGPWTADPEPVLQPGPEGSWDSFSVLAPSVVKNADGYVMYFTGGGISTDNPWQIGRATSPDGIHWTKYDDPATAVEPYAESDPVFSASPDAAAWDSGFVQQPRVQLTPDGWVMLYRSGSGGAGKLGLALSQDGIAWTRFGANPVLVPQIVPEGRAVWYTDLLYQGDTYFLYFELGNGAETNVYVATHEGSLNAP
jgi:predicted GH43/DUF377 family glycosyl hydrolase